MKYAFMSFSSPESSMEELFSMASKFGYDAVELRVAANHSHKVEADLNREQRRVLKKKIGQSPVKVCALASSCRFADPETNEENIRSALQYIRLASDIGVPAVRVFGGSIPEGVSRESAIEQVAASLSRLVDEAGKQKVYVCMETHDDWRDPHIVARVMEAVNHPFIAVNWDVMHPVLAGFTVEEAFCALKKWIGHVHIHDTGLGESMFGPIGHGMVDHSKVLELLGDVRYEGWLSGEWINWGDCEEYLPRELKVMKEYEDALKKRRAN